MLMHRLGGKWHCLVLAPYTAYLHLQCMFQTHSLCYITDHISSEGLHLKNKYIKIKIYMECAVPLSRSLCPNHWSLPSLFQAWGPPLHHAPHCQPRRHWERRGEWAQERDPRAQAWMNSQCSLLSIGWNCNSHTQHTNPHIPHKVHLQRDTNIMILYDLEAVNILHSQTSVPL